MLSERQRDPAKCLQPLRPEVLGVQYEAGIEAGRAGLEGESRLAQAEEAVGEQQGERAPRQVSPTKRFGRPVGEHDLRAGEEGLAEGGVPQLMAPVRGPRRLGRGSWQASSARGGRPCSALSRFPIAPMFIHGGFHG